MLTDSKTTWGHNGSASPAQTALKYASIEAILSWFTVTLLAISQSARSLFAPWHKRGQN
jgi:hypothetical protein